MSHDNRITLTPDERNTLWHVLEFAATQCKRHLGSVPLPDPTPRFAMELAYSKVRALQTRIFGKDAAA